MGRVSDVMLNLKKLWYYNWLIEWLSDETKL